MYFADVVHFDRSCAVDLLTWQAHLSHTILFAPDLMKLSTARPSMPTCLRAHGEPATDHIASEHSSVDGLYYPPPFSAQRRPRQAGSPALLELLSFNAPLFVEQYGDALHPYEVAFFDSHCRRARRPRCISQAQCEAHDAVLPHGAAVVLGFLLTPWSSTTSPRGATEKNMRGQPAVWSAWCLAGRCRTRAGRSPRSSPF